MKFFLITFVIYIAFVKTKTYTEPILFLYEDFELPDEDKNKEILLIKNRPYYPQNCEDLHSVLNLTDGWYYVRAEPENINVYCKSRLLNEECPPTLFCNTTFGLTCEKSSNKCKTKPYGNLLNEKCLNASYCSEKYLLHCDHVTNNCITKTDGNLLNEPCLDDTYCNELYGLRCDQASKRCCTKSRGNLINERCLNNDYCNSNYLLHCDNSVKKCLTSKPGGNILNEPCMNTRYCSQHYHLHCYNNACLTQWWLGNGGNLLGQNCIDDTYCNRHYMLTCVSSKCDTGNGTRKNLLGENCLHNSYCEDNDAVYCDHTCRTGGPFEAPCAETKDCNNKKALSCRENGLVELSSKKCDCDYSIQYWNAYRCVSCPVGFNSRRNLNRCYENRTHLGNYTKAFDYCKSKKNSTLIVLSNQDKINEYLTRFSGHTFIWVNYYKLSNNFYWGNDILIKDIPDNIVDNLQSDDVRLIVRFINGTIEYGSKVKYDDVQFLCEYQTTLARKLAIRYPNIP